MAVLDTSIGEIAARVLSRKLPSPTGGSCELRTLTPLDDAGQADPFEHSAWTGRSIAGG